MDIVKEVEEIIEKLNQLQMYGDNLSASLSLVDTKMCDLRHAIEHNRMTAKGCYRMIQEFKKLTQERRRIRNDMELNRTLSTHFNKLLSPNREFLIHELNKTQGRLNQPYKNRIYSDKQIDYLVGKEDEYEENEMVERKEYEILGTNDCIDD